MNILFLSTENPYPPDHGHHIRTLNILEGLAQKHSIFFVGFAQDKKELQHTGYLEKICRLVYIKVIETGFLKWRYYLKLIFNLFSPYPYTVQRYQSKATRTQIKKIIKENRIDLVHIDMLHLATYRDEVGNVPTILVNHNVESLRMLRWAKVEKNSLIKAYLYWQYYKLKHFERRAFARCDCGVVVSNADKEILCELTGCDNYFVIPNGVDTDYFKPGLADPIPHSLVWVGGMGNAYNRDAVIYFLDEILPLVEREFPTVTATFVGGSPPPKLIKKAAEKSNIKIVGYVDDVRPYVDQAMIFIAPIRSGSGTKIKILNALSQQKAVITTSIGAEGIDVIPNQHLMIADSAQEFAAAISYLFRNPDKISELGKNARVIIEKKYGWSLINEQVNQLYKEIASRSNNRPTAK